MKSIAIIVPVLIAVAYVTLAERKVLGSMQLRKGPNVVGIGGILQPIADGVKLFTKETIIPSHSNKIIFMIAPILGLTLALVSWAVVPIGEGAVVSD
jgi:NADH-quinone oxidoreductase subunit H